MRIGLIDARNRGEIFYDKTVAGGFGTFTDYGKSFFSKKLSQLKSHLIQIKPYHIAYAAAIAKSKGHEVKYITDRSEIKEIDMGILFTSLPSLNLDIDYLKILKSKNIRSGVVGTLASVRPEVFTPHADFVIRGESDTFFRDTELEKFKNGGSEQIMSVPLIQDLDTLPFPDWSVFGDLHSRYSIISLFRSVLPVASTRGCPYSCGYYCPYPLAEGKKMRFRSPENVIEELLYLRKDHGVSAVKFRDPIFTVNQQRATTLLEGLLKKKLNLIWGCETHLNNLDENLIRLMARSGCRLIMTGVESSSPEVLKASKRKSNEERHQVNMLSLCEKYGIRTVIYFMLGLPTDTLENMSRSLATGCRMPATYLQISVSTPYPGTLYYKSVEEKLTDKTLGNFTQYAQVVPSDDYTMHDLKKLMAGAYKQFYFNPRRLKNFINLHLGRFRR